MHCNEPGSDAITVTGTKAATQKQGNPSPEEAEETRKPTTTARGKLRGTNMHLGGRPARSGQDTPTHAHAHRTRVWPLLFSLFAVLPAFALAVFFVMLIRCASLFSPSCVADACPPRVFCPIGCVVLILRPLLPLFWVVPAPGSLGIGAPDSPCAFFCLSWFLSLALCGASCSLPTSPVLWYPSSRPLLRRVLCVVWSPVLSMCRFLWFFVSGVAACRAVLSVWCCVMLWSPDILFLCGLGLLFFPLCTLWLLPWMLSVIMSPVVL